MQSVERLGDAARSPDRDDIASAPADPGSIVFRTGVSGDAVVWPPMWSLDPDEPVQRRPAGGTLTHYQFLMAVTPEDFRAGALYLVGFPVDPGALVDGVKSSWRGWRARRARERVEKELADFRRQHSKPPPD